jgi:hypothetical protein
MILEKKYGKDFIKIKSRYKGIEIKGKNSGIKVINKEEIQEYGLKIAEEITKGTELSIKELKKYMNRILIS